MTVDFKLLSDESLLAYLWKPPPPDRGRHQARQAPPRRRRRPALCGAIAEGNAGSKTALYPDRMAI